MANAVRIFRRCKSPTHRCHVLALRRRSDAGFVLRSVDDLDAICVVVRELGVKDHLRIDINACVDKSDSVNVKWHN